MKLPVFREMKLPAFRSELCAESWVRITCVLRAKSKKTSCLQGSRAIYLRVESRSRVQSSQGMSRVPVHVPEQGTCELQASQLCEFRARCMLESNQVVRRALEPVVDQEQAECF